MIIKYDTPIEVTESQYKHLRTMFDGILAFRQDKETGKCFIKCWMMSYKDDVKRVLLKTA